MILIIGGDKIDTIKRRDCRDHVKRKFNLDKMVDGYEQVYCSLVQKDKDLLLKDPKKLVRRTAVRAKKTLRRR